MRRILFSLIIIGLVGGAAFGLSRAFFSDQEVSESNTFTAGSIDLKVDNTSYYNGQYNSQTSWDAADLNDGQGPLDGAYRFFNFTDIKPGDWGEDTISLRVDTNNAWACYEVIVTEDNDVSSTEPELADGDVEEDENDNFDGELADFVEIALWIDDGDNVYETEETIITQGLISEITNELKGALADSDNGILGLNGEPMTGEETYYLAKAWCFGSLTLTSLPDNADTGPDVRPEGISCDGEGLDNITQTDRVMGDITFTAIQSRHNQDYLCYSEPTLTPTPTPEPLLWIIGDMEAAQMDNPMDEFNFVAFGNFPTPPPIGGTYTRTITSPVDDTTDQEFPWNSNYGADYGRTIDVDFSYSGPTIPVRLTIGWSPGKSQNEQKEVLLDSSSIYSTPVILGVSTSGWWNNMPRYVHTVDFNLEDGAHTLRFLHLMGDGTLWDFIKLERI